MVTVRFADTSDQPRWDTFVQDHPYALLAHQFAFYDFIPRVMNITPYYWMAEEAGEVVGIAPFFLRSHFALGKRLTSIPYLNTGGLLTTSETAQQALWQAISDFALSKGVKTIELRNRHSTLPQFEARQGRSASIIPILATEEAAWGQLKSVARNRIRKAQGHGFEVKHGFDHLEGFWRAYGDNMYFLGSPVLTKRWFGMLADTPQLGGHLITLTHQGQLVAGIVLMNFKNGTENGWTSSLLAARELYCNDLLYWEATQWSLQQGLSWLDLGRSQAGGGHEKFKEKFGAQSIALPYQEVERSASGWQAVTHEPEALYDAFNRNWKRIPQLVATAIGPYFSRQVY